MRECEKYALDRLLKAGKEPILLLGTGISHSGMRNNLVYDFQGVREQLGLCKNFQYVSREDAKIAGDALERIEAQIRDFESRAIYVDDKKDYTALRKQQFSRLGRYENGDVNRKEKKEGMNLKEAADTIWKIAEEVGVLRSMEATLFSRACKVLVNYARASDQPTEIVIYRVVDRGKTRKPELVACVYERTEPQIGHLPITRTEWRARFNKQVNGRFPKPGDWPKTLTCGICGDYGLAASPEEAWEGYFTVFQRRMEREQRSYDSVKKDYERSLRRKEKMEKEARKDVPETIL